MTDVYSMKGQEWGLTEVRNELLRRRVRGQVEHWAVASGVCGLLLASLCLGLEAGGGGVTARRACVRTEDGVELVGGVGELREGLGGLPEVLVVVEEVDGAVVLEHVDAHGVERRDAALGGREGELGAGLDEGIVGVCQLRLKEEGRLIWCWWFLFYKTALLFS